MDLNEAQTRRRIIDKRLALAGWDVNDAAQVTQELDIDLGGAHSATGSLAGHALAEDNPFAGHQFADYALSLHGKPAAVIEAKRTMRGRLARVIVSEDPRVHGKGGLLDQFKNQDMIRLLGQLRLFQDTLLPARKAAERLHESIELASGFQRVEAPEGEEDLLLLLAVLADAADDLQVGMAPGDGSAQEHVVILIDINAKNDSKFRVPSTQGTLQSRLIALEISRQ